MDTERLRALRGEARVLSAQLRGIALEVDAEPDAIRRHLGLDAIRLLSTLGVPAEHNPAPLRIGPHSYDGTWSLDVVVAMEELAAGDAATVLASPGPSMSGAVIDNLGDEDQKAHYYKRLLDRPLWTFFAMTEPAGGSDPDRLETSLTDDLVLTGVKRYIGNGARASLGVVFARTRPGPLGVTIALIDTEAPGFTATPLRTIGLRGAQLSELRFDGVRVEPAQVVGRHLPATRRGLLGAVRTFNRLRPVVAAMALGVARAAYDYVRADRTAESPTLDRIEVELAITRHLIHRAAAAVDHDAGSGHVSSAAKFRAAALAEQVTLTALRLCGPGARLEHPLLDKLARDARGFELMEGTTNMQKLNLFHGFRRGRVPA